MSGQVSPGSWPLRRPQLCPARSLAISNAVRTPSDPMCAMFIISVLYFCTEYGSTLQKLTVHSCSVVTRTFPDPGTLLSRHVPVQPPRCHNSLDGGEVQGISARPRGGNPASPPCGRGVSVVPGIGRQRQQPFPRQCPSATPGVEPDFICKVDSRANVHIFMGSAHVFVSCGHDLSHLLIIFTMITTFPHCGIFLTRFRT